MATVTPVYNWPVPTSTDYVKDGATAIESLGDAIDSSLNSITGGKNVGMVHLNTTTFSAVTTTVGIDNVFTSAYDNYKIVGSFLTSTAAYAFLRFRTGGSTRVTGYRQVENPGSSAFSSSDIRFAYSYANANNFTPFEILISNPAIASRKTQAHGLQLGIGDSNQFVNTYSGFYNTAEANDGFLFLPGTGTMTGEVSVYGLRD
jgi:hypothetical protein